MSYPFKLMQHCCICECYSTNVWKLQCGFNRVRATAHRTGGERFQFGTAHRRVRDGSQFGHMDFKSEVAHRRVRDGSL